MNTIIHMKHAMGEHEYLLDLQTAPRVEIELTPQQEIERLQALIADKQEDMRAFASSPRVLVVRQAEIELLETEIKKWQAAIYAAEHEAFLRVQRAADNGYPPELFRARRAAFIEQVRNWGAS